MFLSNDFGSKLVFFVTLMLVIKLIFEKKGLASFLLTIPYFNGSCLAIFLFYFATYLKLNGVREFELLFMAVNLFNLLNYIFIYFISLMIW